MFNIQFEITNVRVTFTDRSTIRIVDTSTNINWLVLTIAVLKTNQNDVHGAKPTKNHL